MAITIERKVQRVEVYPANGDELARLMVVYEHTIDDPDDDQLPVQSTKVVNLNSVDSNGDATDVTAHDQIVQDICAAVW